MINSQAILTEGPKNKQLFPLVLDHSTHLWNQLPLILRSPRLPELNPISLSLSQFSVPEVAVVKPSAHRQGLSLLTLCASSCMAHTH